MRQEQSKRQRVATNCMAGSGLLRDSCAHRGVIFRAGYKCCVRCGHAYTQIHICTLMPKAAFSVHTGFPVKQMSTYRHLILDQFVKLVPGMAGIEHMGHSSQDPMNQSKKTLQSSHTPYPTASVALSFLARVGDQEMPKFDLRK